MEAATPSPRVTDGLHPFVHALRQPDKPAIVMAGGGRVITYRELDEISNRVAHLLRARGAQIGDSIAICLENHPLYLPLAWGAQRAGLFFVTMSPKLTAPEIAYIATDSGAKLLFGFQGIGENLDKVAELAPAPQQLRFDAKGALDLDAALAHMPTTPIPDERAGTEMLYSSGTTGKPKGITTGLPPDPTLDSKHWISDMLADHFGGRADSVYLSPAPLYHSAPIRWNMAFQRLGATCVIMEKFDPEEALALIEKHRITDSQWVPTHFVRMLHLPEATRAKYDLSSHRFAVHAAAPCPVGVKQQMIAWWGPILLEYYGATEGIGFTRVDSEDWLKHPGTVGRSVIGTIHICDANDDELPPRREGQVYFESQRTFSYHNDPDKTRAAFNKHGWSSVGDIGWVDEQGYLYLTDRKSFMIISGGVNIYPQEIENLLIMHPKVRDVAVIGAQDAEMGERVVAVVQPKDMADAGPALAKALAEWLGPQLSRIKMPRQIDFRAELPRELTGKLFKRKLRDEYWAAAKD